jgi:hypothetical protein
MRTIQEVEQCIPGTAGCLKNDNKRNKRADVRVINTKG